MPIVRLLRPRAWPVLMVVVLGTVVSYVPARVIPTLTGALGYVLWRWRRPREVSCANIKACFPDLPLQERDDLVRRSFDCVALSILETIRIWFRFGANHPSVDTVELRGQEHLEAALATHRGLIMLNCHYGALDLSGVFLNQLLDRRRRLVAVYRKPTNDDADSVVRWARTRYVDDIIATSEIRKTLTELKKANVVWFAADLEPNPKASVFADFFGVPALTNTVLSRMAKHTNAMVLPTRHFFDAQAKRFVFEVLPPFDNYPSVDPQTDANRLNKTIETLIGDDPAPYWWCIKRFRHRPPGVPSVY